MQKGSISSSGLRLMTLINSVTMATIWCASLSVRGKPDLRGFKDTERQRLCFLIPSRSHYLPGERRALHRSRVQVSTRTAFFGRVCMFFSASHCPVLPLQ